MRIKLTNDPYPAQLGRLAAGAFGLVALMTAMDKLGVSPGSDGHTHVVFGLGYLGLALYLLHGSFTGKGAYFQAARDQFEKQRIFALGVARYVELTDHEEVRSLHQSLEDAQHARGTVE